MIRLLRGSRRRVTKLGLCVRTAGGSGEASGDLARLVAVVGRQRLAAGRQVVRARRRARGARQRGGRRAARAPGAPRARAPARRARHVARFPHGRSYNTPNTELFIKPTSHLTCSKDNCMRMPNYSIDFRGTIPQ